MPAADSRWAGIHNRQIGGVPSYARDLCRGAHSMRAMARQRPLAEQHARAVQTKGREPLKIGSSELPNGFEQRSSPRRRCGAQFDT